LHISLCPAAKEWQDFLIWREQRLIEEHQPHAFYCDIGETVQLLPMCLAKNHGHPQGAGRWYVDAHRKSLERCRINSDRIAGHHIARGTELMSEVYLDKFDFWIGEHVRVPHATVVATQIKPLLISGDCHTIPYFQYVYSGFGSIPFDGWLRLSGDNVEKGEQGSAYYQTLARQILWAGLPLYDYWIAASGKGSFELSNDMDGPMYGLLYDPAKPYMKDTHKFRVDYDKIDFAKKLMEARKGFARDFLIKGEMTYPLKLDIPKKLFGWSDLSSSGHVELPVIVHGAYVSPEGDLGFLFINLDTTTQSIDISFDPTSYHIPEHRGWKAY
jgi:hypothetical protein